MPSPPVPETAAMNRIALPLASHEATTALARCLAGHVGPGDALLLDGPLGSGKTHFARALIQTRLETPEDVPSPTYTLVQTYADRDGEIWHCDLFRLSGVEETQELGLDEAFGTALCLVEWPDRLGALAPRDALRLTFTPGAAEGTRTVELCGASGRWRHVVEACTSTRAVGAS